MSDIKVSVVFVSYNTSEYTVNAIESVKANTLGVSYEIIVVDNDSSDNSVSAIEARYKDVKVIRNDKNFGFGYANNIGARYAVGEYLFLLNTDTLLINDAISILSQYLDSNRDVFAVGPNIFDENKHPNTSYSRIFPSLLMDANEFLFNALSHIKSFNFNFNYSGSPIKYIGSISGASAMIRKDVYDSVGGFDERFFLYYEETDLFRRMTKEYGMLASEPRAEVIHFEGGSEGVKETTLKRTFKSKYIYLAKHHAISKVKFHHFNTQLISKIRIILFWLKGNEIKMQHWKLISKIENEQYKTWISHL